MSSVIRQIFSRFERERPQLEQTVDELNQALARYDGIVLYGAGSSGIALLLALQRAGIQPLCFADGAPGKWGTVCMGLDVLPPQELTPRFGSNILVLVCINTDGQAYCRSFDEALRQGGHSGVHQRLHDCGCANVVDYIALRRCFALFHGDNTGNLPSCPDVDCILEHQENIVRIDEHLADEQSKEIFANILMFRLFGEGPEIPTLPQEEKYFPSDLVSLSPEEAFVDCGAFDGQTLRDMLAQTGGRIGAYYAFEPDPANYERLEQFAAQLPEELRAKVTLSRCGAWSEETSIPLYALHGPGSFAAAYGGTQVQATTIDQLLDGRQATAIKMNIEGSELAALRGAEGTIRCWHPKLMIAGYHKTWDFWEVPELMLRAGYSVYLRSYMHHLSFVFYGL
ncbi:MAG: FkbM family methyltransferase [Oscillospiraceae bacterium]|nr:FkbM family methyltransferase [Oscillospiraceae bacterium]